jgi:PIN domain nuclease of toxin-antitoxin system
MKLLVDTQVFLWAVQQPEKLPTRLLAQLSAPGAELYLSVASVWEAKLKHEAGKLPLKDDVRNLARDFTGDAARIIPVTLEHAGHILADPPPTKDPFDRMLLSQCDLGGMSLITADAALQAHRLALRA